MVMMGFSLRSHKSTVMSLAALLLAMAALASAQGCTPSTCPPGPVLAFFEFQNCTGDVIFLPMNIETGCVDRRITQITDNEVIFFDTTSDDCDVLAFNVSFRGSGKRFGVCGSVAAEELKRTDSRGLFSKVNWVDPANSQDENLGRRDLEAYLGVLASSGSMVLRNVNDSFASPQPHFQFNPSFISTEEAASLSLDCFSTDNCTLPSGEPSLLFITDYDLFDCQGASQSEMFPKLTVGGCFNNANFSYMSIQCGPDIHTTITSSHFGSSCDVPPASFLIERKVCGPEEDQTYNCLAPSPSTPVFAPALTGTANSHSISLIVLFCLILSLFFIF